MLEEELRNIKETLAKGTLAREALAKEALRKHCEGNLAKKSTSWSRNRVDSSDHDDLPRNPE